MFCDFTILYTEKVVVGGGLSCKCTFANDENEVSATEYLVNGVILHFDALFCHCCKSSSKAIKIVSDSGIVLNIIVTIEVFGQAVRVFTLQYVANKVFYELLIGIRFIEIGNLCRSIKRRATRRVLSAVISQEIIPVLNDLSIFKSEDVEARFTTKEVVVGMENDKVTIFKCANGIYFSFLGIISERSQCYSESFKTIANGEVVLLIVFCVDMGYSFSIASLNRLQYSYCLIFIRKGYFRL